MISTKKKTKRSSSLCIKTIQWNQLKFVLANAISTKSAHLNFFAEICRENNTKDKIAPTQQIANSFNVVRFSFTLENKIRRNEGGTRKGKITSLHQTQKEVKKNAKRSNIFLLCTISIAMHTIRSVKMYLGWENGTKFFRSPKQSKRRIYWIFSSSFVSYSLNFSCILYL